MYISWLPLACIILQYTGFGLGFGTLTFILSGEILPSDMRSFGSGVLGFIENIVRFFAVKSIPFLISSIGIGGMFGIYGGCTLATLTVCAVAMPETKRGASSEHLLWTSRP